MLVALYICIAATLAFLVSLHLSSHRTGVTVTVKGPGMSTALDLVKQWRSEQKQRAEGELAV